MKLTVKAMSHSLRPLRLTQIFAFTKDFSYPLNKV